MAKKKPNAEVGTMLRFAEEYPIYHIQKGTHCEVKELLGQTHANVLVNQGSGVIIAVPLMDLEEIGVAVVPSTGE